MSTLRETERAEMIDISTSLIDHGAVVDVQLIDPDETPAADWRIEIVLAEQHEVPEGVRECLEAHDMEIEASVHGVTVGSTPEHVLAIARSSS
jgi:hypothetical protein